MTFSDGVIDNLYPYAFHTRPSDAVEELTPWLSDPEGDFSQLATMDHFVRLKDCENEEQRKELQQLYKIYLTHKLGYCSANVVPTPEEPNFLSHFVTQVVDMAREGSETYGSAHLGSVDGSMDIPVNNQGHIVKRDDLSGCGISFTKP